MGKEPGNYTLEIHQKRSVPKTPFHPAPGLALHSLQCVIARALRARGKAGRCGHRPLRNSNTIRCVGAGFYPARPCQVIRIFVGADASVRPPMLYHTSCKRCHCETSSQTGRGNPHPPSPRPPCLKGAGTAKAVTGGYISAPHSLCPKMPPAAPFLSPAKEREERTPPKPMVLDSLRGHGTGSIGALQPRK